MSSMLSVKVVVLALAAFVFCPALPAQAPNDHCVNSVVALDGVTTGNNNASSVGPDPVPSCSTMSNDVWFVYTASCTGLVTATLCSAGTNYDTILAAWGGNCGCLSELACNDDACPGNKSTVIFSSVAGTQYYLSIGGFDGGAGSFSLNISCAPLNPPPVTPPNDHCSTASLIAEGVATPGSTVLATTGGGGPCPGDPVGSCSVMSNDVWYYVVASCSGTYQASTCFAATTFDTVVSVWDGTGGCGNLVEVGCNDTGSCAVPGQGSTATATWTATAGTLYYVSVGGFIGFSGGFDLLVGPSGTNPALSFFDTGPGTIGYSVAGGPPSGLSLTAITLNQGSFPNGPFFGVDMTITEAVDQFNFGYPFLVTLGLCGENTVGPFGGAPSGVTLYAVTLTALNGTAVLHSTSPPASATIP
jgi:hypothetical protein